MLYHHEPSSKLADRHPLIHIIRVAHLLATHDSGGSDVAESVALCALHPESAAALCAAAACQVTRTAADLGINLAGADEILLPSAYTALAHHCGMAVTSPAHYAASVQ